jgi:hypothetical protein
MRSSYVMLGVIYEVTYKVKPISAMAVEHKAYHVDEFIDQLEALIAGKRSMMLYLIPFLDKVIVEYRSDAPTKVKPGSWQWRLRNYTWKTLGPGFSMLLGSVVPIRPLRYALINLFNRAVALLLTKVIRDNDSSPADQIIRYSPTAGFASYTFSIWAFPREDYPQALREYFAFCKQYRKDNNYRCDLLNVGYHIVQDRRSLFSYTRRGPALTLDPVATPLNSAGSCGTTPIAPRRSARRSDRTSWPSSRTCPRSTSQKRGNRDTSVVLPPPDGPTNATTSPGATSRSIPSRVQGWEPSS